MSNIIYRYVGAEGGAKSIFSETIKFSNYKEFNDPFDCYKNLINFDNKEQSISAWIEKGFITKNDDQKHLTRTQFIDKLRNDNTISLDNPDMVQIMNTVLDRLLICCFSRAKSNMLMWSHYTEKHKGFCIGYDKGGLNNFLGGIFQQMVYCRDLFKKTYSAEDVETPFQHITSVKSIDWSYEEEERLIIGTPNISTTFDNDNNDTGIYYVPTTLIKEIYIGAKNPLTVNELKDKLGSKISSNVIIKKMSLSKTSFSLIAND